MATGRAHRTDGNVVSVFFQAEDGIRGISVTGVQTCALPILGIIVNNSESLLNIYNALFLGRPTTTKFLQVYGEETDIKVYEVRLGSSVTDVLGFAGIDVENSGHLTCIDGGPYLHDMGIEELGTADAYVRGTTNALMLVQKGATPYKEYVDITTDPPEEGIVSLIGLLSKGVDLPLGG